MTNNLSKNEEDVLQNDSLEEALLQNPAKSLVLPDNLPSADPEGFISKKTKKRKLLNTNIRGMTALEVAGDGIFLANALSPDSNGSTLDILKVHIWRIILQIWTMVILQLLDILELLSNIGELYHEIRVALHEETKAKSKKRVDVGYIPSVLTKLKYIRNYSLLIYPVLNRIIDRQLNSSNPMGLSYFNQFIPLELTPSSLGVLFSMNEDLVPAPPEMPQPFLDADKKIRAPLEKEVRNIASLRSEYFTRKSAHIAAERVRILSELSRLVVWSSLVPSVIVINIYERLGILWTQSMDVHDQLELISQSILSEFNSFKSCCKDYEILDLESLLPSINLVDCFTRCEINLLLSKEESFTPRRRTTVYLSDHRIRKEKVLDYVVENIDAPEPDFNVFPPSNNLILAPGKGKRYPLKTEGFISYVPAQELQSSLVYKKRSKFGFNLFSKSLYYYRYFNSDQLFDISMRDAPDTSSRSLISAATLIPGYYLFSFIERVKQLRFFDTNSCSLPDPE